MGRKKKFSDEQIREITNEAIREMTEEYYLVVNFNVTDITNWAQMTGKYPNIEYSDFNRDCVKRILEEYRETIKDVTGIVFRKSSSSVETAQLFNARVLFEKYKDNLEKLKEELVIWGNKFNLNANMLLKQSDEIKRLRDELKGESEGNSFFEEENKKLKEQIVLLNNKYEKEREERERLLEFVGRIQKSAELKVIKDCNMALVEEDEGKEIKTLAEQVTYLKEKNKEEKDEHIRRLFKLKKTQNEE